jgi:hypothetical protein
MIAVNPHPRPTEKTVCSMGGLLYFVHERESIRLSGVASQDPVLAKYKFTNIHRRDDRVTQWIINNVIAPNSADSDLWFTLLICRLINWPPTLQSMLDTGVLPASPFTFDGARFVKVVESCKENGAKVYSGAYMIYPTRLSPGGLKSEAIAKYMLGDAIKNRAAIDASLWDTPEPCVESFVEALSTCYGVSTFMAGQVAADLTYTRKHLGGAVDLYTYAPIGPGSSRGLNYLHSRRPNAGWGQGEFNKALSDINERIMSELDITDMTLHDTQNVMCEFGKYCRTVLGEGTPKSTYKPETEF